MNCDYFNTFFSEEYGEISSKNKFAKTGYALLFLGFLFFYLAFDGYLKNGFFFGAALFITGILLSTKNFSSFFSGEPEYPSENEMSKLFIDCVENKIVPEAYRLFDISENAGKNNTYIFFVPVFEQNSEFPEGAVKRKKTKENGKYFYSVWKINILITENNFLGYFSCLFDLLNDSCIHKAVSEFYYSDISGIKTEISDKTFLPAGEENNINIKVNKLIISNVSGDKIEFETEGSFYDIPDLLSENGDELLKELRLKIRNKRFPDEKNNINEDVDFEIEDTRKDN